MTDTTTSAGPDAETLPELTVMGLFLADWEKTKANPTHGNLHYFGAVLGLFVQDYINRVDEVSADRDRLAAALTKAAELAREFSADYMAQARGGDQSGASDHKADAAAEIADAIAELIAAPPSPGTPS